MTNETMKKYSPFLTLLRNMHPYRRGVGLCGILIAEYAALFVLYLLLSQHQIAIPELVLLLLFAVIVPRPGNAAVQDAHKMKGQQKRFAAFGYIGVFYILGKYLWSCSFLPDLLIAFDVCKEPELPQWLSLYDYDMTGTLACMALSVLILILSAPLGKHDRLPRVMFVRLPAKKKAFPVRLLLCAAEAALLTIPLFLLFDAAYVFIGNFGCYQTWEETLTQFMSGIRHTLAYYIGAAAEKIPAVWIAELIIREFQVYVYNRKYAHPDAAEYNPDAQTDPA